MVARFGCLNAPRVIVIDGKHVGPKLVTDEEGVLLVLELVVGAGGVYHDTSWLERWPYITQNLLLPRSTHLHVFEAPLIDRIAVFAEHPLAGARRIHEDAVKEIVEPVAEIACLIVGNNHVAIAPFLKVF